MATRPSALTPPLLLLLLLAASCVTSLAADSETARAVAGLSAGGEFDLDSVAGRRLLQSWGGYIGYDALHRDSVPCSRRGASYYNCRPGAQANPYDRGCSTITQCRG